MYLCTLPHKVIRVEIVSKHTVSKTRGLRRKQCSLSLCNKHITCLHCYYDCSKCSPLALTQCCYDGDTTAEMHMHDYMVWRHPVSKQS